LWALTAVVAWLAGRGFVVWEMVRPYAWSTGDVSYFRISLDSASASGVAHVL